MEGDELPNLEEMLQIWWALGVQPDVFFREAYGGSSPTSPKDARDELQLELVRLLNENLDAFSDRPRLPSVDRPPLADSRMADHLILKDRTDALTNGTKDLAAAARWMLARLDPADRRMLIGLCERVGTFEAAIEAIPDFLAIVETSVEAVWAMAHQRQLMETPWRRVDLLADEINVDAVVFLLDLEIKAGRRDDQAEMVELREKLMTIGGDDAR